MILSASRRTDIPAFYSEWFLNRLRQGYVCVRNPMNPRQVSRLELSPQVVDCIVFWTKNPAPLLGHLDQLEQYAYYFQYTLNAYGPEVEPHLPPLNARINTFLALAETLGPERVIWRYDPILFSGAYSPEAHLAAFARLAKALRGHTQKCVVSLVDSYPAKNGKSLARLGAQMPAPDALGRFFASLAGIARQNGLALASCAEEFSLERYGIQHNRCIDPDLIERLIGCPLRVKPDGQRPGCLCAKCEDVGAYDTCPHGCVYCYANFKPGAIARRCARYDPASPLLCDALTEADQVTVRPVRSLREPPQNVQQLSLF